MRTTSRRARSRRSVDGRARRGRVKQGAGRAARIAAAGLLSVAIATRGAGAQSPRRAPAATVSLPADSAATAYLRDSLGFSGRDIERLERGEVVTRVVAGATAEEVALAGAVRLRVSPA